MDDPMTAQETLGTWARSLPGPSAATTGAGLPEAPETATTRPIYYADLPLDQIVANARQPRTVFDEDALAELTSSMAQVGLLQPVVVRPLTPGSVDNRGESAGIDMDRPGFELVAGERRWRCARRLGWHTIPAVIRPTDDTDLLRDALLENVHRANLNPLEEAAAYQQLLTDFACTQEQLAARVGRSRPQIANTIRLLGLPAAVQRRVAAGVLSQGHARALLALPDEHAIQHLADRIVAEGLSVRMVEEIVAVGDRPTRRRTRAPRIGADGPADLRELAEDLGDRWDTRVQVTMGRTKGKVTIEFAGRDDLDRILELLSGPGTPT